MVNKRDIHENYLINPQTQCWEWKKSLNTDGYAQYWDGNKRQIAGRLLYEELIGKIPEGLELDHLCRNRKCVNPYHLDPVTHAENSRRGKVAKITQNIANEIRRLYSTKKYNQTMIANKYGIGQDGVSRIVNFKYWTI